ncbi:MAG TPA: hypothetical protein VIK08_04195 [Candidatus Limnocylindrales bacterium]
MRIDYFYSEHENRVLAIARAPQAVLGRMFELWLNYSMPLMVPLGRNYPRPDRRRRNAAK